MKHLLATARQSIQNKWVLVLTLVVAAMIPGLALAGGGEANIKLNFSGSDLNYLYASLVLGAIAILAAVGFQSSLKKLSRGDEKMVEVGDAIEAGAMAYLRRQIGTMSIFVVLIAGLLFAMYMKSYGTNLALYVALSFVAGVAASYIAGYAGMRMAVGANTRTACAALTSYGNALTTAFRSGAVAGLFTVGLGLIGATTIFLLAKEDAMKLLVGFGFGGSLAALFMRVGGGIFTKAADVGADLVGKVEAGIPEDDPRNPATIADNVGDNVGDCAGMAADIFESYEVTLVAAIVLGAATSAIFDQQTWMKLILFALMARGAGIIASILGILFVKGSDDIDSDPLLPIRKGFWSSAAIAAALTFGLAYFMLGGQDKSQAIGAVSIKSLEEGQYQLFQDVKKAQMALATKAAGDLSSKTPEEVAAALKAVKIADLQKEKVIKDVMMDTKAKEPQLQGLMDTAAEDGPKKPEKAGGFTVVSLADTKNPVLKYSLTKPAKDPTAPPAEPEYVTVEEFLKENPQGSLKIWQVEVTNTPPAGSGPTKPEPTTTRDYYGPISEKAINDLIKSVGTRAPGTKISLIKDTARPAFLLSNAKGELMIGARGHDARLNISPLSFQPQYWKMDPVKLKEQQKDAQAGKAGVTFPRAEQMKFTAMKLYTADWWRFAACVLFGIIMAFVFEILTDYYVSTHKKPVLEVANVSSAGPAPMIIQGFSYAMESSVFSVLAIVFALLTPLFIFPPEFYGGYILSFYGIALVGLGLLTTTGYILAMDTFGPISDNAQGVFEMSGAGHNNPMGSKAVQRLDAAGNTTKALTKGFAIATAVVAAVALFHSYVEEAKLSAIGMRLEIPEIFLGLMIGGAAPFLFSAFSINAVGRASFDLINEVRRQFREDKGIMAGTSKPDYGRCVEIVTAAAQKELLGPGVLAIFLPVAVGFGFAIGKSPEFVGGASYNLVGAQALGGFLAGAILSGQLMAVVLANSGGIWDNAKKVIEDGLHGGKGTEAHKAGVVCDTVGDPFKDTAGPALNPLIKVMNLVALLMAPLVIKPWDQSILIGITAVSVAALAFSFYWSKRGSMSEGLSAAQEDAASRA